MPVVLVTGANRGLGLEFTRQYAQAGVNKHKHPLKVLAECELSDKTLLGKLLTQEDLTQWLAKKLNIPYYYFDPLRIDVANVTTIFSKAYAQIVESPSKDSTC